MPAKRGKHFFSVMKYIFTTYPSDNSLLIFIKIQSQNIYFKNTPPPPWRLYDAPLVRVKYPVPV